VEETLTVKRVTRANEPVPVRAGAGAGRVCRFSRLYHLRFVAREPVLTGIPPQCRFWRFRASLHLGIAKQLLGVQRQVRECVWLAAHVGLTTATLVLLGHKKNILV
jgi:hypothetical protein